LIECHLGATDSLLARDILNDWPTAVESFWTVTPNAVAMEEGRVDLVLRQLETLQERISVADLGDAAPAPGQLRGLHGRRASGSLMEPPSAP